MKTKKLIKKLEDAFKKDGLVGLMMLVEKKKIRKAVEKAVKKHADKIKELC